MTDSILKQFLAGFGAGYFLRIGDPNHNLFIGRDDDGRYCFEFRGRYVPVKLTGSKPLVVGQYKGGDGQYVLRFSLEQDELIGCFSAFCEDLAEASAQVADDGAVYKVLAARFQAWKKLFKADHTQLSEAEIMGLIGELLYLRDVAIPAWGAGEALDSWTGPDCSHKDFSHGDDWAEVKTRPAGKASVRISSIEQLDSDRVGELHVYCLDKMSPTYNGLTLNAMVKNIARMVGEGLKDLLLSKLEAAGYDFNPAYDNYVYALTEKDVYRVDDTFPRLRRDALPAAILRAQYDLALSEIATHKKN